MKLTPIDVKRQEFKKVIRGYDPVEVETFLGMVASEMEDLVRANRELKDKLIEIEARLEDYRAIEKTLQQTLATAQEASVKSVDNARKEAQVTIAEAEVRATQIVDKARTDLILMKEEFAILRAKKGALISRLRLLLNSELELIRALEVDEEMQTGSGEEKPKPSKKQIEIDEIVKNLDQPDSGLAGQSESGLSAGQAGLSGKTA